MKGDDGMAHIQTESEWELEMCGKIIDYLAGEIYIDMRFMEPVLNVLVPRANMGLSTFATDGVYLYMNTRHTIDVFRKNENFLVRVYLHSVLHCVYSHIWLCDGRDENLWNLACDIAVERIIDRLDKPCVKRILTWRRQDIYKSWMMINVFRQHRYMNICWILIRKNLISCGWNSIQMTIQYGSTRMTERT